MSKRQYYNRVPQLMRIVGKRGKYGLTVTIDPIWAFNNGVKPGTKLECTVHARNKRMLCLEAPKSKK